jgi:hypothetical protein
MSQELEYLLASYVDAGLRVNEAVFLFDDTGEQIAWIQRCDEIKVEAS